MKNRISKSLVGLISLAMLFSLSAQFVFAASGTGNIPPVITPITPPVVNTSPWIGNIVVNPTYNLGSTAPLSITYDYKNLPAASANPAYIIYKSGDQFKTDLSKNYLNYQAKLADAAPAPKAVDPNALKSSTIKADWYGQASTQAFVSPVTYIFEISWQNNGTTLTDSKPFNLTNNTNAVPMNINNITVTPTTFNPTKSDKIKFNFSIVGQASGELTNTTLEILDNQNKLIYSSALNNLGNGDHSFDWDGKDSSLNAFSNGSYKFFIDALTNFNRSVRVVSTPFTLDSSIQNPVVIPAVVIPAVIPPVVSNTTCAGFTDITSTDLNCATYTWVKNAGIFTGNSDGTFNPNGILQRDQVAKTVLEAFAKFKINTEYCQAGNPFPDVTNASWAKQYICLGKKTLIKGAYLLTGYQSGPNQGLFLPGNQVNRSEFLAMVLRNLSQALPVPTVKPYSDVELNQWDTNFAAYAALNLNSIFPGPKLNRAQFVTRQEAAQTFFKLHNLGVL